MILLIKQAIVIDKTSSFHLKKVDLLIEDGFFKQISEKIDLSEDFLLKHEDNLHIIEEDNLHISKGWIDTHCRFGEPSYEQAETIESGLMAAACGGFTSVMLLSPKDTPTDSYQKTEFFINKSKEGLTKIFPIASSTIGSKGEKMVESSFIGQSGALAFADYKHISNSLIFKLILQYNTSLGYPTLSILNDEKLAHNGVVNEGKISVKLGLQGICEIAETVPLSRDILIAKEVNGKLHTPCISTEKSIELIKNAKKEKIDISCSVSAEHIFLTEDILENFNSNFKIFPPLRDEKTKKSIIKAIKEGVVDMICSNHTPIDIEDKKCEFENALFGSLGLQTTFGAAWSSLNTEIDITLMTELLSDNPGKRFNIPKHTIDIGNKAEITLFDPNTEWTFSEEDIVSKAKNSAFIGQKLKGRVIGIVSNDRFLFN